MRYLNPQKIRLVSRPNLNEKLILKFIADDPTVLGLGDLLLSDQIYDDTGISWKGFSLQDPDAMKLYGVQLQLGELIEVRIIRAIECWDIERKRSPQYQHIPVVIVESISTRLLNVLNLFSQTIPFVVIQLSVLEFGGEVGLHFSTLVDHSYRTDFGVSTQLNPIVDRFYWEGKSSKEILDLVDRYFEMAKGYDPELVLEYTEDHIELKGKELPGFILFWPSENFLRVDLVIDKSPGLERSFESAGIDLSYCGVLNRYSANSEAADLEKMSDLIFEIITKAYKID